MNCQEFESRFELLGRDAPADVRTRDAAAAHEESCAACAARVADERALSTGLRALATGMKGAEAPARAESTLLAAFRARAASEAGAGTACATGNVVRLADHPRARRWSWVRTAAAATLAAAAAVALFVLVRPGAGVNQSAMIEPPPGALSPPVKSEKSEVPQVLARGFDETASQSFTPAGQGGQRATSAPRARVANASYNAGARPAALERPARAERPQEIATEFIPLTQGTQYAQSEEGHLVRVELPRSALASFGLPVNFEAASGRVKADVILGEDGTARAIRFVR